MQLDKHTIRIFFSLVAFGVGLSWLLNNFVVVQNIFSGIMGLLFPFILGLTIAFVLNLPMRFIEQSIFRGRGGKLRRPVSFILSLLFVAAILLFVFLMVIPELVSTIVLLASSIPGYIANIQKFLQPYEQYLPVLQDFVNSLRFDWSKLAASVIGFVQVGATNFVTSAWIFAFSFASGIFTFSMGFIFSCYILLDKERLQKQATGLLQAFLPEKVFNKTMKTTSLVHKTFSHFVAGSCMEALAIGALFCVILSLLRFEYALLIGVLIGFMSFIPIFGTTVACIIGALLILIAQGFWPAIFFVVLFLVVQQIDGNFIYPLIVGNSVGLPPIWVLAAVIIGGSLMGVVGMLLFIPLASVLYYLLRQNAKARLVKKGLLAEGADLPEATEKKPSLLVRMKSRFSKTSSGRTEDDLSGASAENLETASASKTSKQDATPPKKATKNVKK